MKFGLAVFPSKEVQDFANSYRKRYDPHYALIQPHLTLRGADDWDDLFLEKAVDHLEQSTNHISPFSILFNRFSTFFPAQNVIYIALSDSDPMIRLHRRICTGILEETPQPYHYSPHLTIGQLMNNDELHDVLSSLRKRPIRFQSNIDRIHLLYQTGNGAWTAYQTFILKGKADTG